ncbi:MAG TPA: LytTR family DNA-binding domain-containing protein, partial [Rhodothermales bacterium]|nr:LytTR family DNA-binding domain-containing protein [Rhodothermales bacterium]
PRAYLVRVAGRMIATSPRLRVFLVDDEPPARERLEELLALEPDVEVVGSFGDGRAATQALLKATAENNAPDVVFLDVQMPEVTGLDVVRLVGPEHMPPVVFVTAYGEYALRAFDLRALDYLVKPFDDARFREALNRAREARRLRHTDRLHEQFLRLLQERPPDPSRDESQLPPPLRPSVAERIAVDVAGEVRLLSVGAIDYISSDGPYAELHVGRRVYLLREPLSTLEQRLDAARFCRIHRSHIVNIDRVEALEPQGYGDYVVRLTGGVRHRVSRSRLRELRRRLGLAE